MAKAKHRHNSSNFYLLSTVFSVFFISLFHPSSLQEKFEKRSLFPNGVERSLFINTNRGQWNGFKLPKSPDLAFQSRVNPVNDLSYLLNTRKEMKENSDPDLNISYKDLVDYGDGENKNMEPSYLLEGKKESGKNIYQLIGSFPELSGNRWELEIPTGRKVATEWEQNLLNEEEGASETSPKVQTNVQKSDKRAKRDTTSLSNTDLCRRYLRLC